MKKNHVKQVPPERTKEQKQALRNAFTLLSENFDLVLIVASNHDDHEALATDLDVSWKGGWLNANSLADFAKLRINHRRCNKAEPK